MADKMVGAVSAATDVATKAYVDAAMGGGGGAQVVSGSYTGNASSGSTNRTISLAFTPQVVYLSRDGTGLSAISNVGTSVWGVSFGGTTANRADDNRFRPLLTSGGFVVAGGGTSQLNYTGYVYSYVAIG